MARQYYTHVSASTEIASIEKGLYFRHNCDGWPSMDHLLRLYIETTQNKKRYVLMQGIDSTALRAKDIFLIVDPAFIAF